MQQNNTTKALVFVFILVLLGFGTFLLTKDNSHSKSSGASSNTQTQNTADYQGFDALLEYGLSAKQLALTEESTAKFVKDAAPEAKFVIVDQNTIQTPPLDPNSTIAVLQYGFNIDDTPYNAKLNYIGLEAIELFVSDQAGKQVFDSGVLQASDD